MKKDTIILNTDILSDFEIQELEKLDYQHVGYYCKVTFLKAMQSERFKKMYQEESMIILDTIIKDNDEHFVINFVCGEDDEKFYYVINSFKKTDINDILDEMIDNGRPLLQVGEEEMKNLLDPNLED